MIYSFREKIVTYSLRVDIDLQFESIYCRWPVQGRLHILGPDRRVVLWLHHWCLVYDAHSCHLYLQLALISYSIWRMQGRSMWCVNLFQFDFLHAYNEKATGLNFPALSIGRISYPEEASLEEQPDIAWWWWAAGWCSSATKNNKSILCLTEAAFDEN